MRFRFFAALILVIAGAGTFWYKSTAAVCPVPLAYRIGELDSRFSITKEHAMAQLQKAESVWEAEADRELFQYDENASFVVDFVFDERQAEADTELSERAILDAKKAENDEIVKTIDSLQEEYDKLSDVYRKQVATYEANLSKYNERVTSYNDQGGAPPEVYEELEQEKNKLSQESAALSKKAEELTALANNMNDLSTKGNALVDEYNQDVLAYNKLFGYAREFTQGDYEGDRINIYKFSNDRELVAVLTHEFGHSLGLDHVEGETSVMYYLLTETGDVPVLSLADKAAFLTTCGSGDELSNRVRSLIRTVLTNTNFL